jgi:hypothetical protein
MPPPFHVSTHAEERKAAADSLFGKRIPASNSQPQTDQQLSRQISDPARFLFQLPYSKNIAVIFSQPAICLLLSTPNIHESAPRIAPKKRICTCSTWNICRPIMSYIFQKYICHPRDGVLCSTWNIRSYGD